MHICCAPCAVYPVRTFDGAGITGFYFNPNIHPRQEFLKRRDAVAEYSKKEGFEVIFSKHEPDIFLNTIDQSRERPQRCRLCWKMRLEKTAAYAAKNSFDAFATTLLISPYQDHLVIRAIGEETAAKTGVDFYYADFRIGFRQAQEEAKRLGLYRQKYCGCEYSQKEK